MLHKAWSALTALVLITLCPHTFAHHHEINYLIVDKLSAPFQLVNNMTSKGGIVTRIVEKAVARTDKQLKHIVSSPSRNKRLKKNLKTPWITYSAKVWQPDLSNARFVDVPLFDVRHSAVSCSPRLTKVSEAQDLIGRKLAILKKFDYPELEPLATEGALNLVPVNNYEQGFMLTKHGRVDGFVEMTMRLQYHMGQMQASSQDPSSECYRTIDLSPIIKPFPIYLLVSKKLDDDNFKRLSATVRKMKQSGEIAQLIESHMNQK